MRRDPSEGRAFLYVMQLDPEGRARWGAQPRLANARQASALTVSPKLS